jgi:catechol 2,3-dioxygenase-like lactoylglutathione lyase family enzyme
MFDHIGLEVTDLERSARFYDALMFAIGGRRMFEGPGAIAYGIDRAQLWLVARGRGVGGDRSSLGHVALTAAGKAAVDAAFAAAMANGGGDDGSPGPRPQYGPSYYAAYLTDPDGYRVEVVSGAS